MNRVSIVLLGMLGLSLSSAANAGTCYVYVDDSAARHSTGSAGQCREIAYAAAAGYCAKFDGSTHRLVYGFVDGWRFTGWSVDYVSCGNAGAYGNPGDDGYGSF